MSLLNDVLRDLDRTSDSRGDLQPAGADFDSPRKKSLLLPAVAGIAVLYWCLVELNLLGLMPEPGRVVAEAPAAVTFNEKWLAQAKAIKADKERQAAQSTSASIPDTSTHEATTPSSTAPDTLTLTAAAPEAAATDVTTTDTVAPDTATAETLVASSDVTTASFPDTSAVDTLLDRADDALAVDGAGSDQTAYALLQSVLVIDPANAQAQAGLADIRSRTEGRIETAVAAKDRSALPALILLGKNLEVAPEVLEAARQTLAQPTSAPAPKLLLSLADRDALLAQKLLGADWRRHEAESLGWIEQGKSFDQTALALAERYHQSNGLLELNRLHEQLVARQAPGAALVLARLHWLSGRAGPAVELLGRTRLEGTAEQVRLRLLGGWLQQMQHYAEAAEAYRPLVRSGAANQTDWLGFAVALDAQGDGAEALGAYREAGRSPYPDAKINAFIQRRIGELTTSLIGRKP